MDKAVTPFDEQLLARYLAPHSARVSGPSVARVLVDWLRWCCAAGEHVLTAERSLFEGWVASLVREGNSAVTARGKARMVAGFYRWLLDEGWIPADPTLHARLPRASKPQRVNYLSRDEAAAMLAIERPASLVAVLHLGILNGLRVGEIIAARVQDLGTHGASTTLHIPHRKNGEGLTVSLAPATASAVARVVGERDEGVLVPHEGRRLTRAVVVRLLDRACGAAGVDRLLRPHDLRRTFITLSLQAGASLPDVQASAGHKQITSTLHYDQARRAIESNSTHQLSRWLNQGKE